MWLQPELGKLDGETDRQFQCIKVQETILICEIHSPCYSHYLFMEKHPVKVSECTRRDG